MIWRTIQVIGGVLSFIGIIALTQGKQYATGVIIIGFLLAAFGYLMRFVTKDK